jgi:hypothetical protein
MSDKVIPSTREDSIKQAMLIWAGIKELEEDAATDKAILESELSIKTWLDCDTEAKYEKHKDKYQRVNDAVKDKFNEGARDAKQPYPILVRHHNRIGRMTLALGHRNIDIRVKTAATCMKNSTAINQGLKLGRNIPREFVHDFSTKLIDAGYDPRYAAQLAVETVKEIETNNAMVEKLGKAKLKKMRNDICAKVLGVLNSKPALIQKDQEMADKGKADTLAKGNKNVKV